MMKSELPPTPALTLFDTVSASQDDVAFESTAATSEPPHRGVLPPVVAAELWEETLVVDDRFGQSPAQMVESKLTRKLQETSLPVSHLQTRTLLRRR